MTVNPIAVTGVHAGSFRSDHYQTRRERRLARHGGQLPPAAPKPETTGAGNASWADYADEPEHTIDIRI